jgi:hypothetical protein
MTSEEVAKLKAADEYWTASRFVKLLFGTLFLAICLIYAMSSVYSNNWVWRPFAHDPAHELLPSD